MFLCCDRTSLHREQTSIDVEKKSESRRSVVANMFPPVCSSVFSCCDSHAYSVFCHVCWTFTGFTLCERVSLQSFSVSLLFLCHECFIRAGYCTSRRLPFISMKIPRKTKRFYSMSPCTCTYMMKFHKY